MLTDDIATADVERERLYSGYKKAVNGCQWLTSITTYIKDIRRYFVQW